MTLFVMKFNIKNLGYSSLLVFFKINKENTIFIWYDLSHGHKHLSNPISFYQKFCYYLVVFLARLLKIN